MAETEGKQYIKRYPKGLDIRLSEHFHLREFECKCGECTETLVSMAHVARLEHLRRNTSRPVKINSAYRCEKHNQSVGGVDGSQHTKGTATDISLVDYDAEMLTIIFPGVILYDTFTHVDSRIRPVFLDKRSKK